MLLDARWSVRRMLPHVPNVSLSCVGRLHSNPVSKICFLFFFPISFSFQLFLFPFPFPLSFSFLYLFLLLLFLFLLPSAVLSGIVMAARCRCRAPLSSAGRYTSSATLAYEWLSLHFGGCSFTVKLVAAARVTRYNGFAKLVAVIKSETIFDIFCVALWHLIETARRSRHSCAQLQGNHLSNWIM